MKPRVIIIEDDDSSRNFLTLLLEEHGYEVVAFSDPTVCPVYSSVGEPCPHDDACGDFLLTDNRMPHVNGLDFIAEQSLRGCKGVLQNKAVMSGTWSCEERELAERLGCRIFEKPLHASELLEWLEQQKSLLNPERKLTQFAI